MPTYLESHAADSANVTELPFHTEVLAARQLVLEDFWAPWCGPRRMIGPVIAEWAHEFVRRANVIKVNVDENPASAQRYASASIPALLIFKSGRVVDQVVGLPPKRTSTKLEVQLN
jgi:thioredoxin 1